MPCDVGVRIIPRSTGSMKLTSPTRWICRRSSVHGRSFWAVIITLLSLLLFAPAEAVIFYSTADADYNTSAPTGPLADSGWQWVGSWGGFQGAAIGPHHFVTARHVGGVVGEAFILNGISYTTIVSFDDPVSDLRIFEVSQTFPSWAPLYRASDEVGKRLVVFGRGLTRGPEIRAVPANSLRGWQWGIGDGKLRWGENTVSAAVNGGTYWGNLLRATFDTSGGVNEAALALGDSSGPVFINNGSGWKLAGIAAAVDGPFNTTNTGPGFNAAIFDLRGLYHGNSSSWILVSGPAAVPGGFYASRISSRVGWIDSITPPQVAIDSTDVPLLSPAQSLAFGGLLLGVGTFFVHRRPSGGNSPR
jgi:hypothetical protein